MTMDASSAGKDSSQPRPWGRLKWEYEYAVDAATQSRRCLDSWHKVRIYETTSWLFVTVQCSGAGEPVKSACIQKSQRYWSEIWEEVTKFLNEAEQKFCIETPF